MVSVTGFRSSSVQHDVHFSNMVPLGDKTGQDLGLASHSCPNIITSGSKRNHKMTTPMKPNLRLQNRSTQTNIGFAETPSSLYHYDCYQLSAQLQHMNTSCFVFDMFFPESLKGARVVVTGASTGIGEQMAYHYARFGAQIVITARREKVLQQVSEHDNIKIASELQPVFYLLFCSCNGQLSSSL